MSDIAELINPFRLNATFIKHLHKQLSSRKAGMLDSFPDSNFFPNVAQLKAIIETLMWASVQYEEGRLTRLRVGFSEPTPFEHLGLVFRHSKELNAEELRRLAPAVLPPDGQIGIWPLGPGKKLRVWGLQTNNLHGTTFEIMDPGRLVVKFIGRFVVAVINGNEGGFISAHWNNHCSDLLYGRYANPVSPIELAEGYFWSQMTEEILRRIRLLKHGGTLLLVNNENRWEDSVDPLFYECEQYLDKVRPIFLRLSRQLKNIDVNAEAGKQRVMALQSAINFNHNEQVSIGDAARAIAYLSSIDGATILDGDFRVLSFAAKISLLKRPKSPRVKIISPFEAGSAQTVRLEEEFRGTRHQSAARFVNANPDARAFVVSQDGEVTGIGWSEEDDARYLTVYRGLELLL